MIFHYIKTIGIHNVDSITFKVAASGLKYFMVIDGNVLTDPTVVTTDNGGIRTYIYVGLIPAGVLFEFYYLIPLTQVDRFSSDTLDTMVSKAICRVNRVRYSSTELGVDELTSIHRVSTVATIAILRALHNNNGLIIEPITSPVPSTSIDILANLYISVFSTNKPLNTIQDIVRDCDYYIVTHKGNINLQLYTEDSNSFLVDRITYTDFNIFILRNSLGGYLGHRFCGAGVSGQIPKLPALGTYSYGGTSEEVSFKYTPYQSPYRYRYTANTTRQIPVEQFPYAILTMFSVLGSSSDIITLTTTEYAVDDYIGKITIPLQATLGYYYIDIQSRGNVIVTDNDYFPYDTSFINIGDINPEDFWVKNERLNRLRNIVRYKTTNKVMPADASKGITDMEFVLL